MYTSSPIPLPTLLAPPVPHPLFQIQLPLPPPSHSPLAPPVPSLDPTVDDDTTCGPGLASALTADLVSDLVSGETDLVSVAGECHVAAPPQNLYFNSSLPTSRIDFSDPGLLALHGEMLVAQLGTMAASIAIVPSESQALIFPICGSLPCL